jgi:glycosyltransferase involved in cell wall biosynthesis
MAKDRPLQSGLAPKRGPLMRLSIVTVSYNAAATLADTLESVARQRGVDLEHWLIDGGSTDDTPLVVAQHGKHLAGYVSERDRGLYDAMNKGAARSRGDVLGFLNADDWYADPDVLAWVAQAFEQGADLVYGDLLFIRAREPFAAKRVWRDRPHEPTDFIRFGWQPSHPTTLVRRSVFDRAGGFDLRWNISADYAFLARAMSLPHLRLRHVPQTLVNMRLGGTSTGSWRSVWKANMQCAQALRELGHWPWGTLGLKLSRKLPQVFKDAPGGGRELWRPWAAS